MSALIPPAEAHENPVPEHTQVTTTECRCGEQFPSLFLLDEHLYGREEAVRRFQARFLWLDAIEMKALETAAEGGES